MFVVHYMPHMYTPNGNRLYTNNKAWFKKNSINNINHKCSQTKLYNISKWNLAIRISVKAQKKNYMKWDFINFFFKKVLLLFNFIINLLLMNNPKTILSQLKCTKFRCFHSRTKSICILNSRIYFFRNKLLNVSTEKIHF